MKRIRVGDRVRIISDLPEMSGKIGTVVEECVPNMQAAMIYGLGSMWVVRFDEPIDLGTAYLVQEPFENNELELL